MKILFAASEGVPFVKTGGLADVLGELPAAIAGETLPPPLSADLKNSEALYSRTRDKSKKPEVVTVLPLYSRIDRKLFPLKKLPGRMDIPLGERPEEAEVYFHDPGEKRVRNAGGNRTYFIASGKYFDRPGLYGDAGGDFPDNDERFAFFSRAVLELAKFIDFRPDVIHAHDWQTGLVPAYLRLIYGTDAFFARTASVFTIHNIAYQGIFGKESLFTTGFGWRDFTPEKLEFYDQINFLKAGINLADKVSTVSPTYASEVLRHPDFGRGMEGVLLSRAADFTGILNGLGSSEWNPLRDAAIAAAYGPRSRDMAQKKAQCKEDLQRTLGLPVAPSVPLVGMVSRLDPQKGFLKVNALIPRLMEAGRKAQYAVLGSGSAEIRMLLEGLARRYPGQFHFQSGFKNDLAHKIYAGADIFLMPSEYEPCGLSQMIAMRYGTLPVVTPTGGLLDTVVPFDARTGMGTGFVARDMTDAALLEAMQTAFKNYSSPETWKKGVRNAMLQDLSWKVSARQYLKLYENAVGEAYKRLG